MNPHNDLRQGDRHRSDFRLRLPEIFRSKLQLLRERTGRPMTVLVQSALKLLFRKFGMWTQPDEDALRRQV